MIIPHIQHIKVKREAHRYRNSNFHIIAIAALCFGLLIGYIVRKTVAEKAIGSAEQKAKNLILDAENKSETIKQEITIEAKEEAHRVRSEVEREVRERRAEITKSERRLVQKKNPLIRKSDNLERREENLIKKEHNLETKEKDLG